MEHRRTGDINDRACCNSSGPLAYGVHQSLTEMEFERGIWYAARYNDLDRVKKFLEKGVSPAAEDASGYTALHHAARNGHYKVCRELLRSGANANALTRSGRATALHRAATQGHGEIVELLLSFGADPNIGDADGYTALHRAILAESSDVCRLLIARTDPGAVDKDGRTALQLAVEKGNRNLVRTIADKTAVHART